MAHRHNPSRSDYPAYLLARRLELRSSDPTLISRAAPGPSNLISVSTANQAARFPRVEKIIENNAISHPDTTNSPILPGSSNNATSSIRQAQQFLQQSNYRISPTTDGILKLWQELRYHIDNSLKPLHYFQLSKYPKPVLFMGIKYIADCSVQMLRSFSTSFLPLHQSQVDKIIEERLASVDAAWLWYEAHLPKYFANNPLGKFRGGMLEMKSEEELRAKLEKDVFEYRQKLEMCMRKVSEALSRPGIRS
jgi:hypothetical protein